MNKESFIKKLENKELRLYPLIIQGGAMDPIQIALIILIFLIVAMNVAASSRGKRKRKRDTVKYASALTVLVKNESKLGGEGGYAFSRFIAENGDNYLVCRSSSNGSKAIVSEKDFVYYKDGSALECELCCDEDGKGKITSIFCRVSSKGKGKKTVVAFSSKPHPEKSAKAKLLIRIAEDFRMEIMK